MAQRQIGRFRLGTGVLATVVAAACLSSPKSVFGLPLPLDAQRQLDSILQAPEYQPRSRATWSEAIGRVLETGLRLVKNTISDLMDWLFGGSSGRGSFNLPAWLTDFFLHLSSLINIVILAGIFYLLYRIIRPLLPNRTEPTAEPSTSALAPAKLVEPQKLFEQQRWAELLAATRLALRAGLSRRYLFNDSATDREIVRLIQNTGPSESSLKFDSSAVSLFGAVAATFEETAFAARPLAKETVKELYDRFCALSSINDKAELEIP